LMLFVRGIIIFVSFMSICVLGVALTIVHELLCRVFDAFLSLAFRVIGWSNRGKGMWQ